MGESVTQCPKGMVYVNYSRSVASEENQETAPQASADAGTTPRVKPQSKVTQQGICFDTKEFTQADATRFKKLTRTIPPASFRFRSPKEALGNVTLAEAKKLCEAQGKYLPSADEWQAASRYVSFGTERGLKKRILIMGGSAADVLSSVNEWTTSKIPYDSSKAATVIGHSGVELVRGISATSGKGVYLSPADPETRSESIGFRCASKPKK